MAGSTERTIKTKIVLEGDKEYASALKSVNNEIKSQNAEMKLLAQQYQGAQNSQAALERKVDALSKAYDAAKTKVSTLRDAIDNAKRIQNEYGQKVDATRTAISRLESEMSQLDTSTDAGVKAQEAMQKQLDALNQELKENENVYNASGDSIKSWETKLKSAYTEEKKLGAQLGTTKRYLEEAQNSTDGCATSIDGYGKKAKTAASSTKDLGKSASDAAEKAKTAASSTKELGKSASDTAGKADKLSQSLDKVAKAGKSMSSVGRSMTTYITTPITAAAVASVKFASDYDENLNKVDVAFRDSAGTVKEWAKTATAQFGLSESAALEAASLFGDMGTSMGLTSEQAADMSTSLTGLAGDLASFKNIGIDEAMTALKGIFTGETESLKSLGVVMTEANLKQFAKDCGLVYDGMSQAEKVTLRYQYVLQQTANAQGDYARTSDGTANSLRTMKSELENLGVAFGQEIIPVITPVIQDTTDLIRKFGELDAETKKLIISCAAVAAAAGPVLSVGGKITTTTSTCIKATTTFVKALSGGSGLGQALTATLGTGGAVGLAIAGMAALTAGTVVLIDKIADAHDPVKQLQTDLEGMEEAQAQIDASDKIISLADQYEDLREKLSDTSLSSSELSAAEAEMAEVRAALAEATNGAVSAEGDFNSELDTTVERERALAEAERERANVKLHAELVAGAEDYQKSLSEQRKLTAELTAAEEHEAAVAETLRGGQEGVSEGYQKLADAVAALRDENGIGIFDTSTIEGAKALEDALNDIENQIFNLTGDNVDINNLVELDAYMERLSVSTEDVADASLDASDKTDELRSKLEQVKAVTEAYESNVISLVQEGYLKSADACDLLGLSEEGLRRKILALEQQEISTASSTGNLAEEHLDAAEAAKAEAEAEKEVTKSLGEIGTAAYQALQSGENLRDTYEDLKKQMEDLGEAGDEDIRRMAEEALYALNLAATNQELAESFATLGIDAGDSLTELSGLLIDAEVSAEEFASGVASMRESVVNDFQLISTENELTADKLVKNLEANLKTQQAWSSNLSGLWKQAYADQDQSVMAFINYLAEKGPEYASVVAEFANGGYAKLQEAAAAWSGIGQQSASDYASGIYMDQYLAGEAASGMSQEVLDALNGANLQGAGSEIPAEFSRNLSSGSGAVSTAAQEMAMAAHTSIAQIGWPALGSAIDQGIATGISGGSAAIGSAGEAAAMAAHTSIAQIGWKDLGNAVDQGIANGISSNSGTVESAASAVAGAAKSAAASVSGWSSTGYNMSAGIASGIRSGSSLVSQAARQVVRNAVAAARKEGDIHSPSRVMEDDVGKELTYGVAKGQVSSEALRAVQSASKTVIGTIEREMSDIDLSIKAITTLQSDRAA